MGKQGILLVGFLILFQTVLSQNVNTKSPFHIGGSFSTSLNYNETSSALHTYEQPFSYLLSVNVSPSVYGFSFPISASYSQMNKSFEHPFYRFGVSPTYKWAKLNLGHRSTNFSQFSVSGQKSFGAGIELTPGKLRLGFMYGKFQRDVGYRTTNPINDFEQNDYSRKGYAAKIGIGSKKNHFDLVFMRIADDLASFDTSTNILPESNVIASAITKFSLGKHVKLHAEVAASVITRDMSANSLDLSDIPNFLHNSVSYLNINSSSNLTMARDFGIDYRNKAYSVGLEYKRVDPEYRSLGAHYFRNDFQNIALKGGYRSKKVSVNANIGIIKDNLKNTKTAQTNRLLTGLNLSLNPTKSFSVAANYSNFSTKQQEGQAALNDTIRMYQVNRNLSVVPMYRFGNKKVSNSIMANFSYAEMLDKNDFAEYAVPVASKIAFLQYMYQQNETGLGLSTNFNYTDFEAANSQTTTLGPTLSATKSVFKKKGRIQLSMSYLWSESDLNSGNIINLRTGFNYKISKKQLIKFSYYMIKSDSDNTNSNLNYDRSRGLLAYTYKF